MCAACWSQNTSSHKMAATRHHIPLASVLQVKETVCQYAFFFKTMSQQDVTFIEQNVAGLGKEPGRCRLY